MFRTSNPALRQDVFRPAETWGDLESGRRDATSAGEPTDIEGAPPGTAKRVMTLQGTVNKSFFMLALVVTTALIGWNFVLKDPGIGMFVGVGGAIAGLVLAIVACIWPRSAPVTAPLYALAEGLFVGAVSAIYATRFGGSVSIKNADVTLNTGLIFNAVLMTFGITGATLAAYASKLIRPGRTFYNVTIAATGGLCLYILIAWVSAAFFNAPGLLSVYDPSNGGMISIGFSALVLLLGAANLVLDFDVINNGVRNRAPRYMEWYGSFALMVTLIWIYLESLRMLAKLQSRRE